MFHAISTIVQTKGLQGLYFGMPAMLTQVSAKAAIRFTAFEQYKAIYRMARPNENEVFLNFVCGLAAGFTEAVVWTTPTERLKVLRQSEISSGGQKYGSLLGGVGTILREQGIIGLYKGVVATGIRQASSVGVRFMLYGEVKKLIVGKDQATQPWQAMVSGGSVGAISVIINNPVDVVKSRIQASSGAQAKYRGTIQTFMLILREEGVSSFFRGLEARVLRVGLGQAITFATYEQICKLIDRIM